MKLFIKMILVIVISAIAMNETNAQKLSEDLRVNVSVITNDLVDSDEISEVTLKVNHDNGYGILTYTKQYTGASSYSFLIGGHGYANAKIVPSITLDLNYWRPIGIGKNAYFGSWSTPGEPAKNLSVELYISSSTGTPTGE